MDSPREASAGVEKMRAGFRDNPKIFLNELPAWVQVEGQQMERQEAKKRAELGGGAKRQTNIERGTFVRDA